MQNERDAIKFDFHYIGFTIKKSREREGLTQKPWPLWLTATMK